MDCQQLKNPLVLVVLLRSESTELDRSLNCFFELFYGVFSRMSINYCAARSYTKYRIPELTDDAFNRGLLAFYQKIKTNGFEERGASVETVFISFCLWQLKGLIKTEERKADRFGGSDPSLFIEKNESEAGDPISNGKEEEENMKEQLFRKGFAQLGKRCQDLIIWRKLLQLDNEEIAARAGIEPASVNNEVYKCMKKLKEIIGGLKGKN